MGTTELAAAIAERSGLTAKDARAALDAALAEITARLANGERVTLTGFGTFATSARAARTARNPRTGAAIEVPASTAARFTPGASLKSAVAGATPAAKPAAARAAAPAATADKGDKKKKGGKKKK